MPLQVNEQLRVDSYQVDGEPILHMVWEHNLNTDQYLTSSITVSGTEDMTQVRDAINEALGE